MFQTLENLQIHYNSVAALFDMEEVEEFQMDLRVQLNAVSKRFPDQMKYSVNWNIPIMEKYIFPANPEFSGWTSWEREQIPPPARMELSKTRNKSKHWMLYGSALFGDLVGNKMVHIFVYMELLKEKKIE